MTSETSREAALDEAMQENVATLREGLGWSRDRLARASGVPLSSIYLLERLGWAGTPDDHKVMSTLKQMVAKRPSGVDPQTEPQRSRTET